MMYIRTDGGSQFESFSSDGGIHWTKPIPGKLASPLSPATIERIPWTGDLLAVWNDHSGWHNFPKGRRTPLCVAISKDDGKTWSKSRVIEGGSRWVVLLHGQSRSWATGLFSPTAPAIRTLGGSTA